MLLLDTCTFFWLSSQTKILSKLARDRIEEFSDSLYVSSVSAFELSVLAYKKKLNLPLKPEKWFKQILARYEIKEISVNSSIFIKAVELPLLHKDPSDRIIIATAQIDDLILLTPDRLIKKYPKVKVEW